MREIHKAVSQTSKPVVLVGHSLGTRAIPLYLEKYKPKVKAVFLIAAFANRLENAYKYDVDAYPDFFEHLIDIDSIKPLVEKFVVMHSKDDPLDYAIVESINKISHIVGLKTIAEFVEDMGTMDILEKLGIDYAQGFGIARPHST
jgi:predicted alpha/beta hydrolase family esterase